MLRRFNTGYEDGNYSVVAGHLEVGVAVIPENISVIGVMHRKSDDERVDFFLSTRNWCGDPANQELDKCDDIGWYGLDMLPVNTIPYVKKAIDNFRLGVWFDEFGWEI